jgi:hypothetical protein
LFRGLRCAIVAGLSIFPFRETSMDEASAPLRSRVLLSGKILFNAGRSTFTNSP